MSKLVTENLELRVRTLEDADAILALGIVKDRDQAVKSVFVSDSHWRKNGFGQWSILLKGGKEFVGTVGLQRGIDQRVEFSIFIAKKHLKKGFASEASRAVLDFGVRLFKLKKVFSATEKENIAGTKLLSKLGFKETGQVNNLNQAIYEKDF